MATKAISVLCLLLCAQVFAVRDFSGAATRSLKQQSSTRLDIGSGASSTGDGSAFAGAQGSIGLVGSGRVTANVQAVAISVSRVRNAFVDAVAKAIADVEGGGDALAIAKVRAEAFALAIAQALASTTVDLQSTGAGGSGCASAIADASATATAFAEVLVEVLAAASTDISFASAAAAVQAIVSATASAYASARSNACGSGVFVAQTYIDVLSTAIAQPFIDVCALAFALAAPGVAIAQILVAVQAGVLQVSTVDGRTASVVFGEASAGSTGSGGTSITEGP